MSEIDRAAISWALSASEDEVFRAIGSELVDGAGRLPSSRLVKLGREWFSVHENELRRRYCGTLLKVLGEDSDIATATYSIGVLIDQANAAGANFTALTTAYVAALLLRKASAGFCEGYAPVG
jgi:hypothetical protein